LSYFVNHVIAGLGFLVGVSPQGISRAGERRDGSTTGNCFFFINFPCRREPNRPIGCLTK
jgi:hypothetical protein